MSATHANLERLQRWVMRVVTDPGGAAAGVASDDAAGLIPVGAQTVEQVLPASDTLSGIERIGIYADMYYGRLVNCMAQDFPGVRAVVGESGFEGLVRAYLQDHPSRSWDLVPLGDAFPAFLHEQVSRGPQGLFLTELATLEWALIELFHADMPEPLSPTAAAKVPADRWPQTRLRLMPTVKLFAFAHDVSAFLMAVQDEQPTPPMKTVSPTSHVIAHRSGFGVEHATLTDAQHALLGVLRSGLTLGEAIEAASALSDDQDDLAASLPAWFELWTSAGLFAAAEV